MLKKTIALLVSIALGTLVPLSVFAAPLPGHMGGTGIESTTGTDAGKVLAVSSTGIGPNFKWSLVAIPSFTTPTLQQVTDAGATTNKAITFAGGTSTAGLITTDVTSTNFYATNLRAALGTFDALLWTSATGTNASITNLAATNASVTSATITSMVATNVTSTNLFATNGNFTFATAGTITASNATITNVSNTNQTISNALDVTGATITGLSTSDLSDASNICLINANNTFTGTNAFATTTAASSTITHLNFSSATGTSLNLTSLATAGITVGGNQVCLSNGTNCPSGTVPTLQQVTNAGNTTTNALVFAGGTSTAALIMTDATIGNLTVTNTLSLPNNSVTDAMVANNLTISGGTIDNSPIGATTPSTGVFTNATTTNFAATLAALTSVTIGSGTSTNFFATNLSGTNLTYTSATGTNHFITNLVTTNATSTNFAATTAVLTSATLGNATSTNFFATGLAATNLTATNATTTNHFSTNLTYTSATGTNHFITNLTATNGTFTNATSTNLNATSLTFTSATSTNLFSTNGTFGTLISNGAITGASLAITGNATIGGTLGVTGASTLATTTITQLTVSGNATTTGNQVISGTLNVAGVSTLATTTISSLSLTTPLPLTSGGTAASLTASNGGIVYSTASALAILSGTATAGQIPRSGANAAPSWSTATYPATAGTAGKIMRSDGTNFLSSTSLWPDTTTINQILYSSAANTISGITTVNSGVLVTNGSGVPSIATDIPTAVTIGSSYIYRVGGTDVSVADGGTGASSLTANGVLLGNGTSAIQVTATGTTNQVLTSNGGATAPTFQTIPGATNGMSTLSGSVSISSTSFLDTGLSVTLPSAGTYLVTAQVRAFLYVNTGASAQITTRFYNSTDSSAITNSEVIVVLAAQNFLSYINTAPMMQLITVTGSKTIKLQAQTVGGTTFTTRDIQGDSSGYTNMIYVKVSN